MAYSTSNQSQQSYLLPRAPPYGKFEEPRVQYQKFQYPRSQTSYVNPNNFLDESYRIRVLRPKYKISSAYYRRAA